MTVEITAIRVEVHSLSQVTRGIVVEVAVDIVSIVALMIMGNCTIEVWSVMDSCCTLVLIIDLIRIAIVLIVTSVVL